MKSRSFGLVFLAVTVLTLLTSSSAQAQVNWAKSVNKAKKQALAENKLIVLDFTADWCRPCRIMEASVWNLPGIEKITDSLVMVQIDITDNRPLAAYYKADRIPKIIVMDYKGEILFERVGYPGAEYMINLLGAIPDNVGGYYMAKEVYRENKNYDTSQKMIDALKQLADSISHDELKQSITEASEAL